MELRPSTKTWCVGHIVGVILWLWGTSPAWHVSAENRCPEWGDGLVIMRQLMFLAFGIGPAAVGLLYTYFKFTLLPRKQDLIAWWLLVTMWVLAVAFAYWMMQQKLSLNSES